MRVFGSREPLHRRLAAAAGLSLGETAQTPSASAASPPSWDGEQRGEPGIHGVPRARRWDAVATAVAPGLRGDSVHFVSLPDGTLVVDEDEPDGTLIPLADALETRLARPYRAEAVRRGPGLWGVAGRQIAVLREPGLDGEEAELVVTGRERVLTVDGESRVARAPALEAAGAAEGRDYVVRATRLDDDLWEVEASAL